MEIRELIFAGCTYWDRPTPVFSPTPSPDLPSVPTLTINPHFLSEAEAIEKAISANNIGHLSQEENPQLLSAQVITYQEAQKAVQGEGEEVPLNHPSETMVWFVRLRGRWVLSGGPAATEIVQAGEVTPTPQPPPTFTTCYAILDANTGELFVNGCNRQ